MSGDGDGSGMYGVLASKFGSGASKIGKKVAQSEAGKSAGRAAIKGASDAAANDLSNRYFGEAETKPTDTVTAPMKTLTVETGGDNPSVVPSQKSVSIDSNDQSTQSTYHSNTNGTSSYQRASKLSRFKPNLNFKSSEKPAKVQPRVVVKKEKVYKYVLTKKPDWDSLPQALTLYNYRAEMKCDLEFRKGQVIQVMTRTDSQNDWWEGKLEGRVGIFPANYVKFI